MLNSVSIVGNLGQDVDLRYTQQGTAVANLNLAVSEFYRDQNGESQKRTHWFRATAFGRNAEVAGEYLKKGSKVGISGQLVYREWEDQNGLKRNAVEIRVQQLEFLNGKPSQQNGEEGYYQEAPRQEQQRRPEPPPVSEPPPEYDDIPF